MTRSQLREIAEKKMKDLNANDIEAAARIIEGSARAMGLQRGGGLSHDQAAEAIEGLDRRPRTPFTASPKP